ncbi:hypothetical protein FKM82_006811 [Ascaphus truei]
MEYYTPFLYTGGAGAPYQLSNQFLIEQAVNPCSATCTGLAIDLSMKRRVSSTLWYQWFMSCIEAECFQTEHKYFLFTLT